MIIYDSEVIIMLENYPEVLTVDEAAEILRTSKKSIYKILQSDTIKGAMIGGRYIIPKKNVIDYLSNLFNR